MLKLNERGWSFSIFIAFLFILGIALILITIGVIRLGTPNRSDPYALPVTTASAGPTSDPVLNNSNNLYLEQVHNYESQLKDVAKQYHNIIESDVKNSFPIVNLVTSNYINKLIIDGNTCTGYVIVKKNEKDSTYQPYIHCGTVYTTEGYIESFDKTF